MDLVYFSNRIFVVINTKILFKRLHLENKNQIKEGDYYYFITVS